MCPIHYTIMYIDSNSLQCIIATQGRIQTNITGWEAIFKIQRTRYPVYLPWFKIYFI